MVQASYYQKKQEFILGNIYGYTVCKWSNPETSNPMDNFVACAGIYSWYIFRLPGQQSDKTKKLVKINAVGIYRRHLL